MANSCCDTFDFPVNNEAISIIAYTADIKQKLGPFPRVEVFHYDSETDSYKNANAEIKFDNNFILIDHGGFVTGLIKLS